MSHEYNPKDIVQKGCSQEAEGRISKFVEIMTANVRLADSLEGFELKGSTHNIIKANFIFLVVDNDELESLLVTLVVEEVVLE